MNYYNSYARKDGQTDDLKYKQRLIPQINTTDMMRSGFVNYSGIGG